jgi:hypothetical protein
MNTLAARKTRSRPRNETTSENSKVAARDEVSPTRSKGLTKTNSSNPMSLVLGSLLLLVLAYFYHKDGSLSLDHTSLKNAKAVSVTNAKPTAASEKPATSSATNKKGPLKFVTIVIPSVVNPKKRQRRLEAITDTWGPASRSIYVVHNLEDEYPNSLDSAAAWPQILQVPKNITFNDGLPRLYFIIRQMYKDYDADFYYFANDHTYVIPEHLCYYLQNQDPNLDMYAGHALKNQLEAFNSGAAGYVLSRTTMRRLIESLDNTKDKNCIVEGDKWLQGNPGLVTAKCLHHSLDTPAIDTRQGGKYHRFHAFGIVRTVMGKVDDWYAKKHVNLGDSNGFDESYGHLLKGEDCCSAETISFHYVEFLETRALFQIRKALLQNPSVSNSELQDMIIEKWPKEWGDLGGYSRGLPDPKQDTESWAAILAVFRKISLKEYDLQC